MYLQAAVRRFDEIYPAVWDSSLRRNNALYTIGLRATGLLGSSS